MAFDTLKNLGIDSPYKERYDNYIGGKWVKPVDGKYFENITPLTCLLYTSPSPRDATLSRMPSSA